jgi:Planctomycete cytochrome C
MGSWLKLIGLKSGWQAAGKRLANKRLSVKKIVVIVVFLALFAGATLMAQRASRVIFASSSKFTPQQRTEGERLFSEKVRPLLNRRCGKCHGEDDARSGLRVDSREALLCGGHRGPAISPGKPGDSLLIQSVLQTGELKMPRRGKLAPEEIQFLSDWIADGAPWPQVVDPGWKEQFVKVVGCVL